MNNVLKQLNNKIMKEYIVDIDITMSKRISISAENEEKARELALKQVNESPYFEVSHDTLFVGAKVTDVLPD